MRQNALGGSVMFWRGLFGRKTAPLPETAPQNKTLAIIDAAYLTSIAHKVDITRLNGVIEHIAGEKPYNTVWFTSFAPSGNDVGFVEALKRGGIEVVQYHHGARTSKCTKCGHVDEFIVQKRGRCRYCDSGHERTLFRFLLKARLYRRRRRFL